MPARSSNYCHCRLEGAGFPAKFMKANILIIAALALVLAVVVFLTLDLHRSGKTQALELFQKHQLLVAHHLARETEMHLDVLFRNLRVLSECPFIRNFEPQKASEEIEPCFQKLRDRNVKEISVSDAAGAKIYSTDGPGAAGDRVSPGIMSWAETPANWNEVLATIEPMPGADAAGRQSARLVIAAPVYQLTARSPRAGFDRKFVGAVTMNVDIETMFSQYLVQVDTGVRAQAWVMDQDGTLLFHSEHPEMTLRNIGRMEAGCGNCHVSMNHVHEILVQRQGTANYAIRNFPEKIAAFAPLSFAGRSWIMVVDTSYEEVTAGASQNLEEALLLLGVTLFAFAGGSTLVYRNHHLKVRAEMESKRWREKSALEDKVRESEERYRTIVETTNDIIWTVDSTGRITFINSSGEQASGYRASALVGTSFASLVWAEDLPRFQKIFLDTLAGAPQTYEIRARNASGGMFVLLANSVPLYAGNKAVGAVSVGRDITARKKAEQELLESQQKYAALVNSIEGIVWEAEASTRRYTFVSTPAEKILGYPVGQWISEPTFWLDHLHPEDRARVAAHPPDAQVNNPILEYRMITADGRTVWFRDVIRVIHDDGRPAKMRGIMVDVSERKRADEILRLSEERFRKMFEEGPLAMALVGLDYRFVKVNAMLCQMMGYTEQELATRTFMDITHPDELGIDVPQVRGLEKGEISTYRREKRYLKKNGELVWGFLTSTVVRDAHGSSLYFLSVIEDVTERKRKEEALIEVEAQLRQAQKMEAVGKLAGGVAHDFNNLLTVIKGYSELAISRLSDSDPLHGDLVEIRNAGNRAAALTSQLLAFARKQILQPRVLDLNAVVTEMNRMLHRLIGENIELMTRLDPDLDCIKADPAQIEQVILNLVLNARDAMPSGGKLIVETQNLNLDESSSRLQPGMAPGQYVLLEMTDTGHGMDKETLAQMFEPFFTTKEVGSGTGLGLSTVYGIIKQSCGYICATSEVGQGSTLSVYLPRAERHYGCANGEDAPSDRHVAPFKETVLLTEDDEIVRGLTLRILESKGYTVLTAASCAEALSIADGHDGRIDLLLTDLVLPEGNGRELAEKLTAARSSMKVIYMSGYTEDDIIRQGLSARSTCFIQKPFTPELLAHQVRRTLDGAA